MEKTKSVFLVWHTNPKNNDEKFIGVYSTRDNARKAIQPLKKQSGFRDSPRKFKISEQQLDRTWWTEGFVTWEEALDGLEGKDKQPKQPKKPSKDAKRK
jgi:hypothetical protein